MAVPEQAAAATGSGTDSPTAHWTSVHLLAVIVFIGACWAARELLVPILIGLFLSLIANPVVGKLVKIHLPRWIAAFVVVFGGVALAVTLISQLVAPAGDWMQRAPQELRHVAPKLKSLIRKVDEANKAAASIVSAAAPVPGHGTQHGVAAPDKPKPPNVWALIRATPAMLAAIGAIILLSYFFVLYGVGLQNQAISLLPDRQRKKLTKELLKTIEIELSSYVLTITLINVALAVVLTLILWKIGLPPRDALLWGAIVGILNFAPYIGPVIGVVMLTLVGVVAFDTPLQIFLPAAVYLGLQILESEVITPKILGRRWAISPLIVLLWLLFCGWLWGIAGVLLAVPTLVCFKIVAERVESLNGWAKVIQ